ncbi:F-box/LRR-repeat protein At3g48880-like [Pistacia vera]|uniref:F-box/LRR-repeat protein At3g48880-like n=1 Tax=Pistacia vera TaxID=55513 RepID=UPI001262F732|nr:F-box/LRR-repeat protein At3g48880-like [Pistacia vera]
MGPFDVLFASTIVKFLPNLKVLSLRCSLIVKDGLLLILDDLPNLEVLNISHSLLIEGPLLSPVMPEKIIKKPDKIILEKVARLRDFLTCIEHSCIMCQLTQSDEGFMRWYKYEEGLWKMDEARSLAL